MIGDDANGDEGDAPGLDPEQLAQVEGEIRSQEAENQASILGSQADFEMWMMAHPGLRPIVMVENFSDILPAIFNFFRAMLGYQFPEKQANDEDAAPDDERSS